MGAKFSKSSKGEKKWDEMQVNGKSLPENFDKTSTLPASFRRSARDEDVVMTGTLPRNLNRNQSFSKRFRKSCKNWAAQRGLIDPCKAEKTETQSQVPTKPSSVVLAQEECKDKITDVAQDLPEVVITKAQSLDMLVESNSMPTASSNEESIETGQEATCEVGALSNSANAEIVIEASSQEIEKCDIAIEDSPVDDSELDKNTITSSEEMNINPESIIEEVQIKTETPDSQITDTENTTEVNVVIENTQIDEPCNQVLVTDTELVVEMQIPESANEINESETVVEKEELNPEVKQEVIDVAIVPSTELQAEKSENQTIQEEVKTEEVVQEVNEVTEESTVKEVENDTETSFVSESVNEVKITEEVIQKESEIVEVAIETVTSNIPQGINESITEQEIPTESGIAEEEVVNTSEVIEGEKDITETVEDIVQELEVETIDENVSSIEVEPEHNEIQADNIITTEEVIKEGNEIVEEVMMKDIEMEAESSLDVKSHGDEVNTVDTKENDESELINEVIEDCNADIISPTECKKEITNEDENATVPDVAEVIEVAEKIEATEIASDNLADKEEDSHEIAITDDNKSEEVMAEDKNNLNISADECNEQETHLEENCVEQEEICTEEIITDEMQDDEKIDHVVENVPCTEGEETDRSEETIVNTTVESLTETVNSDLVKSEDSELVPDEIEKVENVSDDVINSSDGTWKHQWDLPCLASKVEEETVMPVQTPDAEEISREDTTELETSQFELSNEEELNAMNEGVESANTVTQATDDKIESVSEIESKEEANECSVTPCEPENEKKTEALNDELDTPEADNATQFEGESNISLPELEEVEMKTENIHLDDAEPNSLESLEDEKVEAETAINNENKHAETAMKDILTDIVDNIASKSEMTSLENVSDAPADDLISEGGSDGCVSTDEGIAASDDDDKDSCKSDELKKDNAKEIAESEIESLITEIDQHP